MKTFQFKSNCLNCKYHLDNCICGKDGTDTSEWFMDEVTCCELSESAKQYEYTINTTLN